MPSLKSDFDERIGSVTIEEVRADFPILQRKFADNSKALAYLDNGATTQKPFQVIESVNNYYNNSNANVHRAIHRLAAEATAAYEQSRDRIKGFINAASSHEIIFTRGTTESINVIASAWGRKNLTEGDEVILTEMEHHSNLIPWQMIAKEKGAVLRFVPFTKSGELDYEELISLFNSRTKLVSMTHISNVFGTVNEIERVTGAAHERGIPVLVDGAQSAPHIPVDVQALGCDFFAFSGHKMCGPTGIGVLYGKEHLLDEMEPYMGGGDMITSVWLDRATWADLPYKFEAGTPNIAGAVGLGEAIRYLENLGMENLFAYEEKLTSYALEVLKQIEGVEIYGMAKARSGVISFNLDGIHSHDVAQFLDQENIAVRAGHHCAQPVMRKLGVPSTARVSLYMYNTRDEIDRLKNAIVRTQEFFKNGIR
jgi:cysteine desulfurase / selenocysteine lyase